MQKLNMQTPNLTDKNIEQIAKIFPHVISESRDENGNVKKAIDFDLLKQTLSDVLVEYEDERYRLDWPGKKASLLKANLPINKTLRPVVEESVDFENTENLFIEGDNFEVLKILQESYLGKIKMIYIDPPYNTGKDFIYSDKFKKSKEAYEEEIGVLDEEGGKLFKNTDANGRFHSDWLSMMYERLVIARDLLKEDGVIFISIDDNEVANLRKICDEIFGEENFITALIWKKKYGGGAKTKYYVNLHEYILCYSKDINTITNIEVPYDKKIIEKYYKYKDKKYELRGPYRLQPLATNSNDDRPNLKYSIKYKDHEIFPEKQWQWSKERTLKALDNNEIVFSERNGKISVNFKQYLKDENGSMRTTKPFSIVEKIYTQHGTNEISNILGDGKIFSFPKPSKLLKELLLPFLNNNDIVIDFFAGSATTAHAVMQLNAEDASAGSAQGIGNRKFIMVQLPEKTDENSEAYKAGYKTIAEIGKERIRRAGKKIQAEFLEKFQAELDKLNADNQLELGDSEDKKKELEEKIAHIKNLDIGFRVYKTASSNMKEVFYHPAELKQEQLSLMESNIKENRTAEDLLTQVILDLGLELSLPIEKKVLRPIRQAQGRQGKAAKGNTVFFVQHNALAACFDKEISFDIVDEIADIKPFKVVFRDACFKDDKDRINVEERFKRLSPETVITVI